MKHALLAESSLANNVSYQKGYISNRRYEYLRQLKLGDTVLVGVDYLEGQSECTVISNDGERIVLQMKGNEVGKLSFRSFWIKNGRSCGPALTDRGWCYPWLFYYIITPATFGERIVKIIDIHPTSVTVVQTEPISEVPEIPF